eukprot:Skav236270  [mRNA]  locus=scaffold2289:61718:63292:- [translate_table: standard]
MSIGWMIAECTGSPDMIRGQLDEVYIVSFGDERHRPRCAQIALDDLHLIVLANELNVEWSRNLQSLAQLLRNTLHPSMCLNEQPLGR